MRDRSHAGSSRALVTLGIVATVATVFVAATIRAQVPAATCRLLEPGSQLLSSASCRVCHPWDVCHPVDVDYANARARRPGDLHPADVVIGRGAFLPDGQVRCVTCHDRNSAEGSHLALPPGARPEQAPAPGGPAASPASPEKRLCLQCHPWG
jgi:hypothetical protein